MNVAHVAQLGRTLAESLMTSTCTVREPDGDWTTDSDTGEAAQAAGDVVYTGKCRVRPAGTQGSTMDAGGAEIREYDFLVTVPFAVTAISKGHRLTVTASPDPSLVGRQIEVQDVAAGDHISARRLLCTEVA